MHRDPVPCDRAPARARTRRPAGAWARVGAATHPTAALPPAAPRYLVSGSRRSAASWVPASVVFPASPWRLSTRARAPRGLGRYQLSTAWRDLGGELVESSLDVVDRKDEPGSLPFQGQGPVNCAAPTFWAGPL